MSNLIIYSSLLIIYSRPIYGRGVAGFGKPNLNAGVINSQPSDPEQLLWALITLSVVSVLFCALCLCRCLPRLKEFFFSDPDRRNSGQPVPAPYSKSAKSASICSTAQLPVNSLNANVKRGSNAQHFQPPISIEVNQSSPTPPATLNQQSVANARRLSAINIRDTINASASPTLSTNINTISGIHVPYPRSPQPTSSSKNEYLRSAAAQSSGAINELGLMSSTTSGTATTNNNQQPRTPRTRASISNLLMSPKSNADFNGQQGNNNDFEFKNLNYNPTTATLSTGLRAPVYSRRKYSCVAAINPIQTEMFATTHNYLPNQLQKSRRHSRAVADIPSPSQLRNQEQRRKQSNHIQEYDSNLMNQQQQQYQNERGTLNRKKYSLANQTALADSEFSQATTTAELTSKHLVNKPLIQAQQQSRKYSNSSTPNSSRKQSRTDLQQYLRDDEQPIIEDYHQTTAYLDEQQLDEEQYNQNISKYQKRHSSAYTDSQQSQPQQQSYYHHTVEEQLQQEQHDKHDYQYEAN